MVHQGEFRRVTFNKKKPQCFEILNIDDYTESEIEDSWWSEDEQRIQKEQRDKIVESIDKGLKSRRGGSFRGLEKLVVEGYVEMTRRRHRCIDAVMDEQERQWNNLTSNLERIAEFSFVNSQKCVMEALQVGQLDERVARIQDVKFIVIPLYKFGLMYFGYLEKSAQRSKHGFMYPTEKQNMKCVCFYPLGLQRHIRITDTFEVQILSPGTLDRRNRS